MSDFFVLSKQHPAFRVCINVVSWGGRLVHVILKYVRASISERSKMNWAEGEGRAVNLTSVGFLEFKACS